MVSVVQDDSFEQNERKAISLSPRLGQGSKFSLRSNGWRQLAMG
jgi:hypothetical protein